VSAAIALKIPVPEETITASYDSNITYEPTSPASEQPVDLELNQDEDGNNSASLDEASEPEDNNADTDEVAEEAPEEECETPVAGSEYVVIVEIRHCEFAYFELDTPPSDNASSSSDSNNQETTTEPEPTEPEGSTSTADDYEDAYEPPTICPRERAENPEVYDACREGFIMPTSIEFTGIQSCTVIEEGNIEGTLGFELKGGSIAGASWFGVSESSHRNASGYFNILGLSEDSGESWVGDYIITIYFLSMDPRYDGEIAEKTYRGRAVDDVSKCY
jgi:hypothetical protein